MDVLHDGKTFRKLHMQNAQFSQAKPDFISFACFVAETEKGGANEADGERKGQSKRVKKES